MSEEKRTKEEIKAEITAKLAEAIKTEAEVKKVQEAYILIKKRRGL